MCSGPTHRATAGLIAIAATTAFAQKGHSRDLPHPVLAGGAATLFANLPDILEPATNPHHRQFFHSVLFASCVAYGLKRTYEWEPQDEAKRFLRHLILIAGGAYLVHLALDACTSRSLPLVGR